MTPVENILRRRNPLLEFFSAYFKKFPQVVYINLLFIVCSIPGIVAEIILYAYMGTVNIFSVLLYIIMLYPLSGGLIVCCKKLSAGESFNIKQVYFNATSKNALQMLIHGFIAALSILIEFLALVTYFKLAHQNAIYWINFSLCVVLGVFILFCTYLVPLLTVTYELKLKQIYKNAALFTVGAFKNNLFATIALVFFFMIVFSIFMLFRGIASFVAFVLLATFLIPSSVCVIVSFILLPKIQHDMDRALKADPMKTDLKNEHTSVLSDVKEISDDLLSGDKDEFVYYNGRMYKRSALAELKNSMENFD